MILTFTSLFFTLREKQQSSLTFSYTCKTPAVNLRIAHDDTRGKRQLSESWLFDTQQREEGQESTDGNERDKGQKHSTLRPQITSQQAKSEQLSEVKLNLIQSCWHSAVGSAMRATL